MSASHQGLRGADAFIAPVVVRLCLTGYNFEILHRENFTYYAPVGDVDLWESHWDLVVSFDRYSLSEWMLTMKTW